MLISSIIVGNAFDICASNTFIYMHTDQVTNSDHKKFSIISLWPSTVSYGKWMEGSPCIQRATLEALLETLESICNFSL